jgi:hypothetical protein
VRTPQLQKQRDGRLSRRQRSPRRLTSRWRA